MNVIRDSEFPLRINFITCLSYSLPIKLNYIRKIFIQIKLEIFNDLTICMIWILRTVMRVNKKNISKIS